MLSARRRGVILVGGHAVRLNGFLRSTEDSMDIRTLDIEGLLKTTYRDKDLIDRKALSQILAQLRARQT